MTCRGNPIWKALLVFSVVLGPAAAQTPIPPRPPRPAIAGRSLEVRDAEFFSDSLGRKMKYRVLFPTGYKTGKRRYPVFYLLHGLYGDYTNWDSLTGIAQYARQLPLLIVMPDADDSWYANSATVPGDRFEDYVIKDLIDEIDTRYRTLPGRDSRFVAGLSMGGYAAMKFALKYPRLFAFAGSLGGAFDAARDLDERRPEFSDRLLQVFGSPNDVTRAANDVFRLIESADPRTLPFLYFDCGIDDPFLVVNRQFAAELQLKHIPYEYREAPGAHDWKYWDQHVQSLLTAIARYEKVGSVDACTLAPACQSRAARVVPRTWLRGWIWNHRPLGYKPKKTLAPSLPLNAPA